MVGLFKMRSDRNYQYAGLDVFRSDPQNMIVGLENSIEITDFGFFNFDSENRETGGIRSKAIPSGSDPIG
jgi:hypothetical protein